MVRALLFDLDGVLVDSEASVVEHWRQWASTRDLDPAAVVAIAHGRPTAETIRAVDPTVDALLEGRAMEQRQAADTRLVVAMPDVAHVLSLLAPSRVAIVTSGGRSLARARLEAAQLVEPSVLVTADDVHHGKPAPDAYLLAAESLGLRPADCMVIEDAPVGVNAARAAGMPVIALTSTHTHDEVAHADAVVENVTEALREMRRRWALDAELMPPGEWLHCMSQGS